MKPRSIIRQASLRLILSLGLFVLLLGASSYKLYSIALQKSAQERAGDLAEFYRTRLMQLDREWELQASDFKNRLEFTRLLDDRKTSAASLQAFMIVQGSNRRFQHLLIQNRNGDKIFDFGKAPDFDQVSLASADGAGWYRSRVDGTLYRVFEESIWLGESGNGRMALLYEIDHALLFSLATPGIVLTAINNGDAIASSVGQTGLGRVDSASHPAEALEARTISWGSNASGMLSLRIEAPIKVLFTKTELALGAAAIPVIDGLILWFTLGFWLMHNSRRIRNLGGAVEEFAAHNSPTPALAEKLDLARAMEEMTEQNHRLRLATEALLRRNQTLMQHSMDGIHVLDIKGNIVEANDALCRMLGYTREEMAGLNLADIDAHCTHEEVQELLKVFIGKSAKFETQYRRKDGSVFDVEIGVNGLEIDGQCYLLVFCRDITERKQAEKEQKESDRRKDEFLAMLAHELRNPLVPIRNAAHIIGGLGLSEPRIKWAQELIDGQVNHLARLVDDLLDVSRIAQGKIALDCTEVELSVLVDQLMQSIRPQAENKGQQLAVRLPEQAVWLHADSVRISQVLYNLLDNAIKYTQEGGIVELDAHLVGSEIEIIVRDNGMGIPADLLPRVFDLFQQGERTLDRANGGLGIGLTLVQRLVRLHGGSVGVQSDGAGTGAIFTVRLPVIDTPARFKAPEAGNTDSASSGARILLVDDDYAVADSTAMMLELEGFDVRVADSGQTALKILAAFRPKVVLLDIGLKGMDGFEIVKRLRELPEGRSLCVVALTGYGDEKTRARALASGFDYFMVKPVAFGLLRELLEKEAGREEVA